MRGARGLPEPGGVRVDDPADANRLHNKGWLGTPLPGNRLRLHPVEAAYAIRQGRLTVDGADWMDLLGSRELEVQALAFTDLRDRGLVVRPEDGHFVVWRRGQGPKDAPWFRFHARSERTPVAVRDLLDWARDGAVVGVVDDDGAVTHYLVEAASPEGTLQVSPATVPARLLGDRWLVTEADACARLDDAGMGTPYGDARVLSLLDGALLGEALHASDAERAAAEAAQPDLHLRLRVARDLAARGVLVRSGFRFGAHLRGYRADPDGAHADWLVHCSTTEDLLGWSDVARAVRLAHGVRKRHLVAVAGATTTYAHISWFRP